jgi:hypothetical protein
MASKKDKADALKALALRAETEQLRASIPRLSTPQRGDQIREDAEDDFGQPDTSTLEDKMRETQILEGKIRAIRRKREEEQEVEERLTLLKRELAEAEANYTEKTPEQELMQKYAGPGNNGSGSEA